MQQNDVEQRSVWIRLRRRIAFTDRAHDVTYPGRVAKALDHARTERTHAAG